MHICVQTGIRSRTRAEYNEYIQDDMCAPILNSWCDSIEARTLARKVVRTHVYMNKYLIAAGNYSLLH
jgi:hypothetical protein